MLQSNEDAARYVFEKHIRPRDIAEAEQDLEEVARDRETRLRELDEAAESLARGSSASCRSYRAARARGLRESSARRTLSHNRYI